MLVRKSLYNVLNPGAKLSIKKLIPNFSGKNFNVFMNSLVEGLTKDLDDSYAGIIQRSGRTFNYETLLNNVKSQGFKVFRNSQGKHKLKLVEPEKINDYLRQIPNPF